MFDQSTLVGALAGSAKRLISWFLEPLRSADKRPDGRQPHGNIDLARHRAPKRKSGVTSQTYAELAEQEPKSLKWLEAMRDHIAGSVSMGMEDFQLAPIDQQGGLGRAYALFGKELFGTDKFRKLFCDRITEYRFSEAKMDQARVTGKLTDAVLRDCTVAGTPTEAIYTPKASEVDDGAD